MSVKICYEDGTMRDYCEETSVADQLVNANHIHITVSDDQGRSASSFLQGLANLSSFDVLPPVELRVEKDNMILGAKVAKQARDLSRKITIYWLAKEMVKLQKKIDTELGDIVKDIKERII